jgi:catechol 2,3-dioxygenase-like lactoylglutathione lyase family enzyme
LQITLIVRDLERTAQALKEAFGLEVAFRDPSVELWGLENIVLPMGTTFIEVLAPGPGPKGAASPGARHLARQGGDAGYMVILQTRGLPDWKAHVEACGVRIAFEAESRDTQDGQDWAGLHLNPADSGGMMISFDEPDPPDSWAGAGPDWRDFIVRDVVTGLAGIALRSPDPERLAARWSEILRRPLGPDRRLSLDQGWIDFVETQPGEVEGLARVYLVAAPGQAPGDRIALGGVVFELIDRPAA